MTKIGCLRDNFRLDDSEFIKEFGAAKEKLRRFVAMRNIDRELFKHIAECLGIQDRKLTRLVLRFDAKDIARIETEEFVGIEDGEATYQEKRFELKEVDMIDVRHIGDMDAKPIDANEAFHDYLAGGPIEDHPNKGGLPPRPQGN